MAEQSSVGCKDHRVACLHPFSSLHTLAHAQPFCPSLPPQYREEDVTGSYPSNIMFDRRVVRGNTYAARILPADVSLTDTTGSKAGTG